MGYGLLDTSAAEPQVVVMDVLYLRKIADFHLRIHRIFESTQRIIDMYHPDHLAIEAPFVGKNAQSMLKLGKAQGVAIGAAMSRGLSYTEFEPAVIKQRVTGNGNAAKEQVAMMLQGILHFENIPRYLDASDALAVAYACYLDQTDPLCDVRSQLKVKRATKSRKAQWGDFVKNNPDMLRQL